MKKKEELLLLLEKCKQIQSSINKKIPLAPNRYEEFEQIKRSEIEEFIEARRTEAQKNHKEPLESSEYKKEFLDIHEAKQKAHEIQMSEKKIESFILNEINQLFDAFLVEHKVISEQKLTEKQKNQFKNRVLKESHILCEKLIRTNKLLGIDSSVDKQKIDDLLKNIDDFIAVLCQGKKLSIQDEKLAYRFKKDREVTEHRDAFNANFNRENTLLIQQIDPKVAEIMEKKEIFAVAQHFDRPEIDVGYCGEHAKLALKRLYDEGLIKENTTVELITITYFDDKGNREDNHSLLAINRDPDSLLNDISTWDGILLDPWNKITCLTNELNSLPHHYAGYSITSFYTMTWKSIKFTYDDYIIRSNLNDALTYFSMTGNDTEEKRVPLLIEEHQLISLEKGAFAETKSFLYEIVEKVRPDNFNVPIEIFITTRGARLVDTLAGFSEPKIIIHSDFLKQMHNEQNGVYTVEELKFALANALLYIKHEGVGIYNAIPAPEQYNLDKLSIEKSHNSSAAISYFRKSIVFEAQNKDDVSDVKIPTVIFNFRQGRSADFSARIKSLMTLLANKVQGLQDKTETSLPDSVLKELAPITRRLFYKEECDLLKGTVEKLNYLKSKLPDLTVELLPYEMTGKSGIRVRDFCQVLNGMAIDLNDPSQLIAANQLINRACELRVPAFELIYLALVHQPFNNDGYLSSDVFVQPLGFFSDIEDCIQDFIAAQNFKEAKKAAEKLTQLREKNPNHFSRFPASDASTHLHQFKRNNIRGPRGGERFFGSCIGTHIRWSNFKKNKDQTIDEVPWLEHLEWAEKDDSHIIADTLWSFGINNDRRLWVVFGAGELFAYAVLKTNFSFSTLPNEFEKYSNHDDQERLLEFLSKKTLETFNLQSEMLVSELSFEEQFMQFYDRNRGALVSPSPQRNTDNSVIRFLLSEFSKIAKDGTPEEKAIVKSFFFGRKDKRDLSHLIQPKELGYRWGLRYKDLYVSFIIKQEFEGKIFKLFAPEEQIKFLTNISIYLPEISAHDFIGIFDLPFDSLSIDCVEQLILLIKADGWYEELFKNKIFLDHMEEQEQKQGSYRLFTSEAVRLVRLVTTSQINSLHEKNILAQFRRDIPQDVKETHHLTVDDLILLYRSLDSHLIFSCVEEQESFATLLMQRIVEITEGDEQIRLLETLLFVGNKLTLPLSNIQLRNEAIGLLIKDIVAKYGKDDNTPEYKDKMIALTDRIFKNAAKRDAPIILSRLADAIESQRDVTEHMGILLEPDKYVFMDNKESMNYTFSQLAVASKLLSEDKEDVQAFLNFISSPITHETTDEFATYLLRHDKTNAFAESLGYGKDMEGFEKNHPGSTAMMLRTLYAQFWDLKLEERAVLIEHLLIPANAVRTPEKMDNAYQEGFRYVSQKLFPNVETDKDEEFALALLKAYLDSANQYIRSHLLAGMLVATNEAGRSGEKPTAGKKLALLCEHMGPAYIKLAQAVHSHPNTPEHIRRDLDHVKGRANPPYRWHLWRLVHEVLPTDDRKNIKRIGALLGSASYNLALEAELNDGQQVVLLMLRENAAKDAEQGFAHLKATIKTCAHPKIELMRESIVSIISEAEALSVVEMDKELSEKQNQIAAKKYKVSVNATVDGISRTLTMKPSRLIKSGEGYRFIERVYGTEFNDLPNLTKEDKDTRRAIATAVITLELINILSGGCFDSDRHGNQLRYEKNTLGLYDFGEMSLEPLGDVELRQLGNILGDMPKTAVRNGLFGTSFDTLLSEHIRKAGQVGEPTRNLMRVRKAFLALRDFQKELSTEELFGILKSVNESGHIHGMIKTQFSNCMRTLGYLDSLYQESKSVMNGFKFFSNKVSSLFVRKSMALQLDSDEKQTVLSPQR